MNCNPLLVPTNKADKYYNSNIKPKYQHLKGSTIYKA